MVRTVPRRLKTPIKGGNPLMNKSELAKAISDKAGITRAQAGDAIDALVDAVVDAMVAERRAGRDTGKDHTRPSVEERE